jgi:hypothetical protein
LCEQYIRVPCIRLPQDRQADRQTDTQ